READVAVTALHFEPDLTPIGELHRVAREVDEDLPDLVDVTGHASCGIRDLVAESEPLRSRQWLDHCRRRADDVGGEEVGGTKRFAFLVDARGGPDLLAPLREDVRL